MHQEEETYPGKESEPSFRLDEPHQPYIPIAFYL